VTNPVEFLDLCRGVVSDNIDVRCTNHQSVLPTDGSMSNEDPLYVSKSRGPNTYFLETTRSRELTKIALGVQADIFMNLVFLAYPRFESPESPSEGLIPCSIPTS
jgi:hypothetical protein